MANARDFLDYVAVHATDAPEDLLLFQIQEAVTDFLIDTKIATDFIRIPLQDYVHDYVLDTPECHTILGIKRVIVGQACENVVDWEELKATKYQERQGYYADIDNEGMPAIWIGNPSDGYEIEITYSYTIGRGACEIPQFVYDKYARLIQHYTLSRIYGVMGQEWSSAQLSSYYMQMYEKEVGKLKVKVNNIVGGKFKATPFLGRRNKFGFGGFFR